MSMQKVEKKINKKEFTALLNRPTALPVAKNLTAFVRSLPAAASPALVLVSCHDHIVGLGRLEPHWVYETRPARLTHLRSPQAGAEFGRNGTRQCDVPESLGHVTALAATSEDSKTTARRRQRMLVDIPHAPEPTVRADEAFARTAERGILRSASTGTHWCSKGSSPAESRTARTSPECCPRPSDWKHFQRQHSMQDRSDDVDGRLKSTTSVIPLYAKARVGGVHAASIQLHGPTAARTSYKTRGS